MQKFPKNLFLEVCDRYVYYSYLQNLIFYSHAGHKAREPFSLLATSAPIPRLNIDEDIVASERAGHLAVLMLREDKKGEALLARCDDFMCKDWSDSNGNIRATTVDMCARTIYYAVMIYLNERALPTAAKAELKAFWVECWPEYKGQQVNEESIDAWKDYLNRRDMQKVPLIGRIFLTSRAIYRRALCDLGRLVARVNDIIFSGMK